MGNRFGMKRIEDAPHLRALEQYMKDRYGLSTAEYLAWSKTLTILKRKYSEEKAASVSAPTAFSTALEQHSTASAKTSEESQL